MVKPKAGEVKGVKKRAASVTPKKQPKKRSKEKDVGSITIADGRKKEAHKKIAVTAVKEVDRKIEILQNISRKSTTLKKKAITPNPSTSLLASRISLALMIPFKTSLDQPQLVSNVARYAGTMFVVLGAFFTLYNMSAVMMTIDNHSALTAQTTTGTCATGTNCYTTDPTSLSGPTNTILTTSQDPTPDVAIRVEAPNTTLIGTVPVNVTVPYADRVDLIAFNTKTQTATQVGTMSRISDLVWRTYWRTTMVTDGAYRFKTVVTNRYGTYTEHNSTEYTVLNHPVDESVGTVSTSSSNNSTSGTSTTTTDSTAVSQTGVTATETGTTTQAETLTTAPSTGTMQVILSMSEPLKGGVSIRTLVEGASSVPVYVKRSNTTSSTLLGYASLHTAGEWRYVWDTKKMPDGEYDLKVQAQFPNNTSTTKTLPSLTVLNTSSETSTTTASTIVDSSVTNDTTVPFTPQISILLAKSNPLEGQVDVYVNSSPLSFVELYVLPEKALTPKFVGLAQKQSETSWRYRLDTLNLPNGNYDLFARVRHQYGDSESSRVAIRVFNEADEPSSEEVEYIETLKATGTEVESTLPSLPPITATPVNDESEETEGDEAAQAPQPTFYTVIRDEAPEEFEEATDLLIEDFRGELQSIMEEYSKALRAQDQEKVRTLQNKLEQLRERVMTDLPFGKDREDVVTRINEHLGLVIKDVRERIERSETLIRDRVGDAITKDSDTDGVSDYDEVNLYETDPFSSDTDKDGFIDGIEILNGYDPKDEVREANVQYESPRDIGVVRDDLLTIDYITTVEAEETEAPKAQIAGKALPNSFVTLYIFSTPIIVTVKTDSDGNWTYLFDKELENGEHEVYVGMTDNAGRIVAKSNPLSFVKTAEAFTPIDAEASAVISTVPTEPSLISSNVLLIIGSLSVVSLGLVLILLGLHVRPKEPELQPAS